MGDTKYKAPGSWHTITGVCGHGDLTDYTTLFYNNHRWTPIRESLKRGCMETKPNMDRSFVIQPFQHTSNGMKVIVIGAHFPHSRDFHRLTNALQSVMHGTSVSSVILIADTNQRNYSSTHIMEELKVPHASRSRSSHLLKSCCLSKPGFKFPYDRIITNTPGPAVTTTLLLDWFPLWAVGEPHKPILARISPDSPRLAGTAQETTTSTINSSRAPTSTPSA